MDYSRISESSHSPGLAYIALKSSVAPLRNSAESKLLWLHSEQTGVVDRSSQRVAVKLSSGSKSTTQVTVWPRSSSRKTSVWVAASLSLPIFMLIVSMLMMLILVEEQSGFDSNGIRPTIIHTPETTFERQANIISFAHLVNHCVKLKWLLDCTESYKNCIACTKGWILSICSTLLHIQ